MSGGFRDVWSKFDSNNRARGNDQKQNAATYSNCTNTDVPASEEDFFPFASVKEGNLIRLFGGGGGASGQVLVDSLGIHQK